MSEEILIVDSRALPKLQAVLQRYREVSRKSVATIIEKETSEWRLALWAEFKKISPKPSAIIAAATERGFRVKRTANAITPTESGLARSAVAAADSMMDGMKSQAVKIEVNANGVFIRPVRFSSRNGQILRGGRSGHKFAAGALTTKTVNPEIGSQVLAEARNSDPSLRILNKRALGVALELSIRSRAAKGGTMALQWLGTNFKKRSSSTVKSGPQVIRSTKGIPLGMIEFEGSGDNLTARLQGFVPGTAKKAASHGIFGHVVGQRIADRLKGIGIYLERAKEEALKAA